MSSLKLTLNLLCKRATFEKLGCNMSRFRALVAKVFVGKLFGLFSKALAIKVAATSVLLTLIVVVFSASIAAQEHSEPFIKGIWLTGTEGGKIETYQKDGQWFGKLVASENKDAPLGTDILRHFMFEDGQWHGEVYSIKREQLADATIDPSQGKLVIEVSIAFFSKTLEWHNENRVQE
jgi:hypothetical protein